MTIEVATDLDGYEAILWFSPNMFEYPPEMMEFIRVHQLVEDPADLFYMASADRFFVIVHEESTHERDSSGEMFIIYRRMMA